MMFGCLLEHLENLQHIKRSKTFGLGLNALFWCTEATEIVSHQMHPFYFIRLNMMFGCVLEHLENLRHVERCKTCVSGLNVVFCFIDDAKMVSHQMHPFYSIGPQMMFSCLLEHLENLRHVKRCKTFVSGLNELFCCTEVAEMGSHQMHPFYSI
jgi:ribosomal protein L31